jgi:AAA+ ATPase superfamily predicted ATPase
MLTSFVGRRTELALLKKRLDMVTESGAGVAVAIRGRRQVGKSRLVQEFCDESRLPYLFFAATRGASPIEAVTDFVTELRHSELPRDRELVPSATTWPDAFRALAAALPDSPAIVVLDELPWLAEQDEIFDGALQTAWDRLLSRRPVLLLLLGSDLHMMRRLTAYDSPFYGRADNVVLGPLNPAETGAALGLDDADAVDAHLVSGGLPGILRAWPDGLPALPFLERECADAYSPVFGVPESALLAEFPDPDRTRRVLEAIGGGDRTYANIAATAGSHSGVVPSGTLSPLLHKLTEDKQLVATDHPLATQTGKPALYRVADSNLRLYLAVLRGAAELVRRGRTSAAFALIERRWATWRGRAVEPLVRESLELAAASGELPWPEVGAVGGWWNRQFDPEIDLVGADRAPVAERIMFVGSIKWLTAPFDRHDLARLRAAAPAVPGHTAHTGVVVASRAGAADDLDRVDLLWRPTDLINAWR